MYQKILVPLDGSKLAECVLPYVEELARGCGAQEVILLSVTEPVEVHWSVPDSAMLTGKRLMTETIGKKTSQAQRYLRRIWKKLNAKGINVRTEVLIGNPAKEIASYAEQNACDLIAMASHGRSGPSRWAFGSVADKVFRASCVAVLMARAPGCMPGI
jgi:nucleotide-binding universal stress UspA family protein